MNAQKNTARKLIALMAALAALVTGIAGTLQSASADTVQPGPRASRTGNATGALTGRRAVTSAGGLRPVMQTTGSRP